MQVVSFIVRMVVKFGENVHVQVNNVQTIRM